MKQRPVKHLSQSALLLLELIIATAYLALSSVVCIRLYLYAHSLSAASAAKTNAIREVQNLGEAWLSSDGSLPSAIALYQETAAFPEGTSSDASADSSAGSRPQNSPDSEEASQQTGVPEDAARAQARSTAEAETSLLYYNGDWEVLPSGEDAAFCIALSLQEDDTPGVMDLTLTASSVKGGAAQGEPYYSLTVKDTRN